MKKQYEIKHVRHEEINFVKWDNCINNSHNGNIYAFSWYLDILSENWEALIENNYESVMPILPARKAGFNYTYNSYLANQLGVFSTNILDQGKVNAFITELSTIYPAFNVNLNKFNNISSDLFRHKLIPTYEFDIIGDIQTIRRSYSQKNIKAIEEAENRKVNVIRGLLPNDFLYFAGRKDTHTPVKIKPNDLIKLRKIIAFVLRHGLGEIYAAYDDYNDLIAACLFLKSNRKINILYTASTEEDFRSGAMHKIIDLYIQRHAGQNLTLNFENLYQPKKKEFCMGFGSKEFYYSNVKNPHLPWRHKIILSFVPDF